MYGDRLTDGSSGVVYYREMVLIYSSKQCLLLLLQLLYLEQLQDVQNILLMLFLQ